MPDVEDQLHYLSIQEAADKIRRRELSPVEVVQASLDRIEATEDRLHSFITLLKDEALEQARTAEAEILGRGQLPGAAPRHPLRSQGPVRHRRDTDHGGI